MSRKIAIVVPIIFIIAEVYTRSSSYMGVFLVTLLSAISLFFLRKRGVSRSIVTPVVVLFMTMCVLSIFWSVHAGQSIIAVTALYSGFVVISFVRRCSDEEKESIFKYLSYTLLIYTCGLVLLYLFGWHSETYVRLIAHYPFHNVLAGIVSITWLMWLYQTIKYSQWYTWLCLGVVHAALVLTFSRGGWVSLILGFVIALICIPIFRENIIKYWKYICVTVCMASVIGLFLHVTPGMGGVEISSSATETNTSSIYSRVEYMKQGLRIGQYFNYIGSGFGTYGDVYGFDDDHFTEIRSPDPHNLPIRLFAEVGIIGSLLFVISLSILLYSFYSRRKNVSLQQSILMVSVLVWFMHSFIELQSQFFGSFILCMICIGLCMEEGKTYSVHSAYAGVLLMFVSLYIFTSQLYVGYISSTCMPRCIDEIYTYTPFGARVAGSYVNETKDVSVAPYILVSDYISHQILAIRYIDMGMIDKAISAAQQSLLYTPNVDIEGENFVNMLLNMREHIMIH